MTRFRPFLNGDPPALVDLWNRGLPDRGVARPLDAHEFDALVMGKLHFERAGLVVAERDGRPVGFAHAGFGPLDPDRRSHQLCRDLGTVAMLVVDPDRDDPELEHSLLVAAERYLRERGATVLYAGGQYPLNPFYWGLYGGSECSGVLSAHATFHRAVRRAGYEPSATSVLMEADLGVPEARDPKAPLIRRRVKLEIDEDAPPARWWDSQALGPFRTASFRLVDRADGRILASALTWEMAGLARGPGDDRSATGLISLEVHPDSRRQGLGRHLVGEILRHDREQMVGVVTVQTETTNVAALALYRSLGFQAVETGTLYRLPVAQGLRLAGESGPLTAL